MKNIKDFSVAVERSKAGIKRHALLGIKRRLYVPGYVMRGVYHDWVEEGVQRGCAMTIAYSGITPIGAAVLLPTDPFSRRKRRQMEVHVFVRPKYRRKGVGTKLMKRLRPPKGFRSYIGSEASDPFYKSIKKKLKKKRARKACAA